MNRLFINLLAAANITANLCSIFVAETLSHILSGVAAWCAFILMLLIFWE